MSNRALEPIEPVYMRRLVEPIGTERGPPVSYAQHLVNEFPDRFEAPRAA